MACATSFAIHSRWTEGASLSRLNRTPREYDWRWYHVPAAFSTSAALTVLALAPVTMIGED